MKADEPNETNETNEPNETSETNETNETNEPNETSETSETNEKDSFLKQRMLKKAYAAMDRIEKDIHFIIARVKEERRVAAKESNDKRS